MATVERPVIYAMPWALDPVPHGYDNALADVLHLSLQRQGLACIYSLPDESTPNQKGNALLCARVHEQWWLKNLLENITFTSQTRDMPLWLDMLYISTII